VADLRGRPFAYVALTLSVWVGARVIISVGGDSLVAPLPMATTALTGAPREATAVARSDAVSNDSQKFIGPRPDRHHRFHPISTNFGLTPVQDPWQDGGRPSGLFKPALVAGGDEPQSAGRDTPPSIALALTGEAGQPEQRPRAPRGWGGDVYAYSFWRYSTGSDPALAPGAQYGGSQSGIIATIDPFGAPDRGLSLLARGSVTPDGNEREVALGFRWRPGGDWPLTLSAERRFRANAPDRFAAYLAGGIDALPVSKLWSLDAFGQAGYATGLGGGGFFDAQARVMHPLTTIGSVPMSGGIGGWAGGQKGAMRFDIGPTIATKVEAGSTSLLIQLDWRLRAAGNAEPKNGLALTVSTGF
jgi:hypothetical protein